MSIKNQLVLTLTKDNINEYIQYPELLKKENLKNISCVVIPESPNLLKRVMFFDDTIYEFKIDFYNTGNFDNDGFFTYCKVEYDTINNNYKLYSYYSHNRKLHPTILTRKEKYNVIELLSTENGIIKFKGPIFTVGFRKGSYDEWILNPKIIYQIPPTN